MRAAVVQVVLALAAAPLRAAPPDPVAASRAALSALAAELDEGDSAKAQGLWSACLELAEPGGREAGKCRLYAQLFGPGRPDPAGDPAPARVAFLAGLDDYRRGREASASRRWRECVALTVPGTSVWGRCLAAQDLLLPSPPPLAADESRQRRGYVDGMNAYIAGEREEAGRRWRACALAPREDPRARSDCRAALAKLERDETRARL